MVTRNYFDLRSIGASRRQKSRGLGNRQLRIGSAGLTLAEIMVSIAILGVIFAIAPKVMIDTYRFFRLAMGRSEIQRDARASLDMINRQLRQAKASTVIVSSETGQPPYSKVTFDTVDKSTVSFWPDGKTLKMRTASGGTRKLAENLRYIAFTYVSSDNDNIMSVSVTFEKDVYAGKTKALQMAVEKVRIMNN
jgi:prepilin-type N-terminal cleavage/methylation domain-containing protein